MTDIIVALIGLIATGVGSVITYLLARKYIGPSQEKLISTLKDLISAQDTRQRQLEEKVNKLEIELKILRELTVSQALTIDILTERLRQAETNAPKSTQ